MLIVAYRNMSIKVSQEKNASFYKSLPIREQRMPQRGLHGLAKR
jgi:hypothetical protein